MVDLLQNIASGESGEDCGLDMVSILWYSSKDNRLHG